MTNDLFEHNLLCKKCDKKMKKLVVERSGFKIRAWECPGCGQRTYHPADLQELNKFRELKGQNFQVKLRKVGNSYTVSIPKEIINLFDIEDVHEREDPFSSMHKRMKENMEHMNKMVNLALEQANKLSLSFGPENNYDQTKEYNKNGTHAIIREKSESKPINLPNGRGFVSRKMKIIKMTKSPKQEIEEEQKENA